MSQLTRNSGMDALPRACMSESKIGVAAWNHGFSRTNQTSALRLESMPWEEAIRLSNSTLYLIVRRLSLHSAGWLLVSKLSFPHIMVLSFHSEVLGWAAQPFSTWIAWRSWILGLEMRRAKDSCRWVSRLVRNSFWSPLSWTFLEYPSMLGYGPNLCWHVHLHTVNFTAPGMLRKLRCWSLASSSTRVWIKSIYPVAYRSLAWGRHKLKYQKSL